MSPGVADWSSRGVLTWIVLRRTGQMLCRKKLHCMHVMVITKPSSWWAAVFPVVMYKCESWTTKKAEYWRTDVSELWCWRRLESPLSFKEIKLINPKENQPWIFIGRTDAKPPILWPTDVKSWYFGKDADAGKDWRQEEKGTTEDEVIGWHHQVSGHEFEQTLGYGEGQGRTGKPSVLQSQTVGCDLATEQEWWV